MTGKLAYLEELWASGFACGCSLSYDRAHGRISAHSIRRIRSVTPGSCDFLPSDVEAYSSARCLKVLETCNLSPSRDGTETPYPFRFGPFPPTSALFLEILDNAFRQCCRAFVKLDPSGSWSRGHIARRLPRCASH